MGLALPEIKQKGWDALVRELGYAGERKDILKETTIEKVREDILKNKP
jgi:hypothetical protein